MKNEIQFDFSRMLAENFDYKKYAISKEDLKNNEHYAIDALKVVLNPNECERAIFDVVENPGDLDEIIKYGEFVAEHFENIVVLGIGGSALGTRTILSAITDFSHKKNKEVRHGKPNWFVRDSINPEKFQALLNCLDVTKTMFFCVSKSGGTIETLIQLSIVLENLKEKMGPNYFKNVCVITANENSKLHEWAKKNDVKVFWFSNNLSGRFSVLSAVGLVPSAAVGLDIKKLVEGGRVMLERCKSKNIEKNPALFAALLQKICVDKGMNVQYLMPYADSLKVFADWWCQLWAESLGKSVKKDGVVQFYGQTPVDALGPVDQHSQLQLCLDGAYDKVITFLSVKHFKQDKIIPKLEESFLDEYLSGKSLAEICNVSQHATEEALKKQNRISQNIILDTVDEFSVGQLFMFFMMETSFLGSMFGFNKETYNQPSVEEIKEIIKKVLA